MLLLAQAQPEDFGPWISNAFYVVGFVTACVVLYQRMRPLAPRQTRIEGQPVVVKADTEFAPLPMVQELKSRVDRLDDDVEKSIADMRTEVKDDFKDMRKLINDEVGMLHTRTNDVLSAVSRVQGQLNSNQSNQ